MAEKQEGRTGKFPGGKPGVYLAAAVLAFIALVIAVYIFRDTTIEGEADFGPPGDAVEDLRKAAEEARAFLKITPGAKVAEGEPSLARYWECHHVEIADTLEGVAAQVEEGLCDYVVIDSLWVRRHAPGLKTLITGVDPLPGAGLVYRRYFTQAEKLISVYRRGAPALRINPSLTRDNQAKLLTRAAEYKTRGYVEHARQLFTGLAKAHPNNEYFHLELMKIYIIYGYYDGVSLDRADDELLRYAFLVPDQDIRPLKEAIQTVRLQHQALWGGL